MKIWNRSKNWLKPRIKVDSTSNVLVQDMTWLDWPDPTVGLTKQPTAVWSKVVRLETKRSFLIQFLNQKQSKQRTAEDARVQLLDRGQGWAEKCKWIFVSEWVNALQVCRLNDRDVKRLLAIYWDENLALKSKTDWTIIFESKRWKSMATPSPEKSFLIKQNFFSLLRKKSLISRWSKINLFQLKTMPTRSNATLDKIEIRFRSTQWKRSKFNKT